jgi:hypothetical protein
MIPLLSSDSSAFRVVYDVRHAFPETFFVGFLPLAVLVLGIVIYRQRAVVARFGGSAERIALFGIGAMVIGGAGALFLMLGTVVPDLGLRLAVSRGRYDVREGTVTDFVSGDAGDHRSESWTVRTASNAFSFSYSPSILEPGYNKTAAHGGQIANGLHVRVWEVDGRIARLEVSP